MDTYLIHFQHYMCTPRCNHDQTHRVCAKIGNGDTSFFKFTGQANLERNKPGWKGLGWCGTEGSYSGAKGGHVRCVQLPYDHRAYIRPSCLRQRYANMICVLFFSAFSFQFSLHSASTSALAIDCCWWISNIRHLLRLADMCRSKSSSRSWTSPTLPPPPPFVLGVAKSEVASAVFPIF